MDYSEEFFRNLKPANEQQRNFIYWVMMTQVIVSKNMPVPTVQPRYARLPGYGISAIHDVFYNSLHTSMQAMRVCEMADVMDAEAKKRLEEMALLANSQTDAAAAIGSALLTLEDELIKANEPRVHIQFERTSGGKWIVNQMSHGSTLLEATVAYCTKRISKIPRNKAPKE